MQSSWSERAPPEGCAAKAKVSCGKVLQSLDPGEPSPGSSLREGAHWEGLRSSNVLPVKTELDDGL